MPRKWSARKKSSFFWRGDALLAPVEPGTANEAEPRNCDYDSNANEPEAMPPMPDVSPPGDSALPEPSAPMEPPPELPPEQPKQN